MYSYDPVSGGSSLGGTSTTYNTYEYDVPFTFGTFVSNKSYWGYVKCNFTFNFAAPGCSVGGMAVKDVTVYPIANQDINIQNETVTYDYNSGKMTVSFWLYVDRYYVPVNGSSINGYIRMTCSAWKKGANSSESMVTYCTLTGTCAKGSGYMNWQVGIDSNAPATTGQQQQQTQELEKQTQELQEQTETQKGIWESIKEFFAGFFDGIINALISVFVPDDGYFEEYFNRLNTFFSERLGLLYEPIDVLVRIVNAILSADGSSASIPIPEIAWDGQVILSAQTFTFDELLSNPSFKALQDKLHFVTSVIMVGALLALVHKKSEEVMRN